ncbi:MAG: hypothetical protein P4M15_12180 [Alphaproteobacteria bacterium]|nr:hypothetical protein [Alphaproteobacteria bacterium]
MLGLIGVGAGILFSSYSQTIRSNIQMTNSLGVKSDLDGSATTLAATSVLGASDPSILCPPQGGAASSNCAAAPVKMTDIYPAASLGADAHVPVPASGTHDVAGLSTYAAAGGSPVEVGVFTAGAGTKQLDPWGHYYIYCRWESAANSTVNPAIMVITPGPDGILQTNCGSATAGGDDTIIRMDAANAVNRSSVWQTGTVGSSTPAVYYGSTGHQLTVDANGNLVVPGNITVNGDYTSPSGNATLSAGDFNGNVVGGTIAGSTGNFSSTFAAEGSSFSVGAGGTVSAAGGSFLVNSGGAFSAGGGNFTVGTDGALGIGSSAFTVSATGVVSAASGVVTIGTDGTITVGTSFAVAGTSGAITTATGTVNIGSALPAVPSGSSTPYLTLGKKVGSPGVYPFSVDQYGAVTSQGGFNGTLNGDVNGGSVTATTLHDSGTMQVDGNYTSAAGNITLTGGTVTAANFVGNMTIGSGGTTFTGVMPIANGGTGANNATGAIGNLTTGVTNTIPGAALVNNSVGTSQIAPTGVAAGTYNSVTVTTDGRITIGSNTPVPTGTSISDGSGEMVATGTSGLTFQIGSATVGFWNSTGFMVGTGTPTATNKLDVNGNQAIGVGYAGVKTAPANGLIVEGSTAIGTSVATTALTVNGTVTATTFSGSGSGLTGISTSAISGTLGTGNGGTGTNTTFTQGSVVFAGASGNYAQDNANFFWDATNHRLGIGTATPGAIVSINNPGTSINSFEVHANGGGGGSGLTIDQWGNSFFTGGLEATLANSIGALSGGSNDLQLETTTAGKNILLLLASGGKVAIGTSSPTTSLLDIYGGEVQVGSSGNGCSSTNGGAIRYNSGIMYYCDGSSTWQAVVSSGGGGGALGVSGGGTGDTTLTAHSVLVGEGTSPVGTAGPGAVNTVLVGMGTATDPAFSGTPTLTNLTLSGAEMLQFGVDISTTGISTAVPMTASAYRYIGAGTATFESIAAGTSGQILTLHNASASKLTLADQSDSTDATTANRIITGTGADLPIPGNSSVTMQYDGTTGRWRVTGSSNAAKALAAGSDTQIQYNNNGAMAGSSGLVYDYTNGQVGIGTSAPGMLLQAVSGGDEFHFALGKSSVTPSMVVLNTSGKAAAMSAGTNGSGISYDNTGFFQITSDSHANIAGNTTVGAGTVVMYMSSGGNVGVGTNSFGAKFTVNGNADVMGTNGYLTEIANDTGTGTTVNLLAKMTSNTAVIGTTGDTDGMLGVVVGGAGKSGNAQIAIEGQAACVFDNATTAGDYVTISALTNGQCHDSGVSRSLIAQTVGRVLVTNASSGGTNNMMVMRTPAAPATGAPTGTGTTNYAAIWKSATTLGTGTLVDIGTGVGIGTSSPAASLQIASGQILMPDGTAGTPAYSFTNNTNMGIFRSSSNVMAFAAAGNNIMSIDASDIYLDKAVAVRVFNTTAYVSADAAHALPTATTGMPYIGNTQTSTDGAGGFLILQAKNSVPTAQQALIGAVSVASGNTPNIVFGQQTGASTYAEAMRISTSGNLGIGTTTPGAKLTVNGAEALLFGTDYSTVGIGTAVALTSASAYRYTGIGSATFESIAAGTSGQLLELHNASASALTVADQSDSTDATTANRVITGTGSDLVMTANSSITMQYDGTTSRWRVIGGSGGGIPAGTTGQVQFNSGSNTFAADANLVWDNTNKILAAGVGATVPVATSGTVAGVTVNVIPQAISLSAGGVSGGVAVGAGTTGQMAYYSAGTTLASTSSLYWDATNGRVGVGTSVPGAPLSIYYSNATLPTTGSGSALTISNGDVSTTSADVIMFQGADDGNAQRHGGAIVMGKEGDWASASGNYPGYLGFYTRVGSGGNDTEKMRISSAGYVGIGTTNPNVALSVNGSINIPFGGAIFLGGNLSNGPAITTGYSNTEFIINGGTAGFQINNQLNNAVLMYMNNSGTTTFSSSVAIGTTTTPATALVVNGTTTSTAFSGDGSALTNLNAGNLASGTVPTARLGSGTANSTTYLRGDQTWAAVASGTNIQTFTSSGTWTKPGSGNLAYIECWGGGGSGGTGSGSGGGGGGGGGYGFRLILLSALGSTETVTVGTGGAAVSATNTSGNSGGTSTFGTWAKAYGGGGGGANGGGGGAGGTMGATGATGAGGATSQDFDGGPGGTAGASATAGLSSHFGGGGGGGIYQSGSNAGGASVVGGSGGASGVSGGTAGNQPGGGGGGRYSSGSSGKGGDGECKVTVW